MPANIQETPIYELIFSIGAHTALVKQAHDSHLKLLVTKSAHHKGEDKKTLCIE